MINPQLKKLMAEQNELIKKRMDNIDNELKKDINVYDDKHDFNEDIEMKLQELAIKLLEKQGFPFGEYRIKQKSFEGRQSDFALLLSLNETLDKKRYLLMKGKRRKLWNRVVFLDLNSRQGSLMLVLSMLGSSFIKLVIECRESVNQLMHKRVKVNENIKINETFKFEKIEGLEIKQEQCRSIDFRFEDTAKSINFGIYDGSNLIFLNDNVYNSILNAINERKDDIKKFIKLREKILKEMDSHINEPYLGMLGLE
ncbi:MAG: hypothetical protein AABW67_03460 [Nanoarchaeota archaeon]